MPAPCVWVLHKTAPNSFATGTGANIQSFQWITDGRPNPVMEAGTNVWLESREAGLMTSDIASEVERLLGHAAFRLWPELPRDVQERLFETAVPNNPAIRNSLARFLHDHHPRTWHPPKPTLLA
jgi:hypothetical protein